MRSENILAAALGAVLLSGTAGTAPAQSEAQAAIDGCKDQLRAVGGPDGQSSEVLSQQWGQAGTLVRLLDAGGSTWECIGYSDGSVGDLRVVEAMDDSSGAMADAAYSGPIVVRFQPGTSGATYDGTLDAGGAIQYVLNARDGQFLTVRVFPEGAEMAYQIRNPDDSQLNGMVSTDLPYEGQLWQGGDHVVEIVNRTSAPARYRVDFEIR